MRKIQYIITLCLASVLGAIFSLLGYSWLVQTNKYTSIQQQQNAYFANLVLDSNNTVPTGLNFIYAANLVRPAVVHIKTNYTQSLANYHKKDKNNKNKDEDPLSDMFRNYHGDEFQYPRQSSGSGVIITDNGFIVTNNHVIKDANSIEVVLDDKRSYKARVIGKDVSTDLALLKIEEENLAFVKYGNSDKLQIGEWVLAIGNPFDLTSTVTAGIVSAKGRNINLLTDNQAIESFIQTDAAVNPGNSGGALVNLKGELIGVNTAIATHTGYYAGYSFAIPITIVKKVMNDLMNYGETQRALLGITIDEIDAQLAKEKKLNQIKGVYVKSINEDGAAKLAGLQAGDVIIQINKEYVNSFPELQSIIASYSPGDKIALTYLRNGKPRTTDVILKNKMGGISIVRKYEEDRNFVLGAELSALNENEKKRLGISSGVKVNSIGKGKIKASGMREGFIIMRIESKTIYTTKDVLDALLNGKSKSRTIAIDGIYPNGTKNYYAIGGW